MGAPPFAAPKCETMFGASCAKQTTTKMPSRTEEALMGLTMHRLMAMLAGDTHPEFRKWSNCWMLKWASILEDEAVVFVRSVV
mmetsp:Transcript_62816/g.99567  ORF Transcript_62816/g.99567 Transcript_62816/m.99567 type:complete len:83 (+) Transcript_62816:801-1049(+)